MKINFFTPPKLVGIILLSIGLWLVLFVKTGLYIKIGFCAIFIGLFVIFVITEKTVPKELSNSHVITNIALTNAILSNLSLDANAIFLSPNPSLSEERVFIPVHSPIHPSKLRLPKVHKEVFITGVDGTSMGVSLPPACANLLQICEKETGVAIKTLSVEDIDARLGFLWHLLGIKNVSIRKTGVHIAVNFVHAANYDLCENIRHNFPTICTQYCCPICASIICSIVRCLKKSVAIQRIQADGPAIKLELKVVT